MAIALALLNVAATVHRSLIPVAISGTVERIDVVAEKHPGIDDVWLVRIDGVRRHVDAATAGRLTRGARVHKGAWQRRLDTGGATIELALSPDAQRMLVVMPLMVLLCAGLVWRRRVSRRVPPTARP